MKRLTILGIIACVGLLLVPASVIGAPAGPPEGLNVNVVNQPTVDARQSGVWKCGIVPWEPYVAELYQVFGDGVGASPSDYSVPEVPEGKQAVIEHVSLIAVLQDDQTVTGLEVFSNEFHHFLSMNPQGRDFEGHPVFVTSQPLRAYLSSGTALRVQFRRGPTWTGTATVEMHVTGYLIDDTP